MVRLSDKRTYYYPLLILLAIVILYIFNIYNYLFYHSLIEIFSILVSFTIFIVAYNSRKYIKNNFFILIGVGYLFIGIIDLIHTLAYKGMGVFSGYGANLPTQLWISARILETSTFFVGFLLMSYDRKIEFKKIFAGYLTIFVLLIISIFYIPVFPDCYVEGSGLTPFKKVSEYLIAVILVIALFLLYKNREKLSRYLYLLLSVSIIFTILSEISFTFYVSVYDFSNMVGHIFKLLSFILIYESLISTGIRQPFSVLFKEIRDKEKKLEEDLERIKKDEERIEELKEEYELIFNNTQDAMFLVEVNNENFRYLRLNSAHERMTGLSTSEVKGKTPKEITDDETGGKVIERYKECVEKREAISYEEELELPSGKKYWSTKLTPVKMDGEVKLIVGSSRDITERKKIEERDKFLHSLLRHDLKNKLMIADGYLELLEEAELGGEYDEYVDNTIDVFEQCMDIIKKVRELREAQEEEIQDVDIESYLEDVVEENRNKADEEGIDLIYESGTGCRVKGGDLLKTVFTNLIENAIKHGNCSNIKIINKQINDDCVITIEDDGRGIEDKEDIFEKGYKEGENAGTGLGLYLVKEIIENYGGSLEVDDSELGGARFEIRLKKAC